MVERAVKAYNEGIQLGPVRVKPRITVGTTYVKDGPPVEDLARNWAQEKYGEAREFLGKTGPIGDRIKDWFPAWDSPERSKTIPAQKTRPEPQAIVGFRRKKDVPHPGTGDPFEPVIVPLSEVKLGQPHIPIGVPAQPPSPAVAGFDPIPLRQPVHGFNVQFEVPLGFKEGVDRFLWRFGW
jgi:hypothetical protein